MKLYKYILTVLVALTTTTSANAVNIQVGRPGGSTASCANGDEIRAALGSWLKAGTIAYENATNTLTLNNVRINTEGGDGDKWMFRMDDVADQTLTVVIIGTCYLGANYIFDMNNTHGKSANLIIKGGNPDMSPAKLDALVYGTSGTNPTFVWMKYSTNVTVLANLDLTISYDTSATNKGRAFYTDSSAKHQLQLINSFVDIYWYQASEITNYTTWHYLNCEKTQSGNRTIVKRSLNQATTAVTGSPYTYTGSNIKPATSEIVAMYSALYNGINYSCSIKGYDVGEFSSTFPTTSVNSGIYSITLTGTSRATGANLANYIIRSADLSSPAVTVPVQTYTGNALTPSVSSVVYNGATLVQGTDYTVVTTAHTNAGTYPNAVMITGIGNYTGTFYAAQVIQPRDLNSTGMTLEEDNRMDWNGMELTPNINTTTGNNVILTYLTYKLSTDDYTYTVDHLPIMEPGTYRLTFFGRGNFVGERQVMVTVQKDFDTWGASLQLVTDEHSNNIVLPNGGTLNTYDFTIQDGATLLTEGKDYAACIYASATDASTQTNGFTTIGNGEDGLYWLVVTGMNAYRGSHILGHFNVLNEYYSRTEGKTSVPYDIHVTSVTEAHVGTLSARAVDADTKTLTLSSTATVTLKDQKGSGSTSQTVDLGLKGIDNNAFEGCNTLRYIDAEALACFTPVSLERSAPNTPFYGLPAQTLVYLTGSTVAGENYIYNTGAAQRRCDAYKIYEDLSGVQTSLSTTDAKWDYVIPHDFYANTVTNNRQLNVTNSGGKQQGYTICLPYDLPVAATVKAYTLCLSKGETTMGANTYDGMVGFTEVTGTLHALTPYVLLPLASGQPLSCRGTDVCQTEGVTMTSVSSDAVSGQARYKLTGTMSYLDGAAAKDKYIMQSGNVWNQIKDDAGDYGSSNKYCILPMRAYLEANGSAARMLSIFTDADGSTSAVENFELDADEAGTHDLQGRRVRVPQRGNIYIVNGKKLLWK